MPDFTKHNDVLELLNKAQEAEHDTRHLMKEAHLFVSDPAGQWDKLLFESTGSDKPRYTFDQTSPVVDQISGDIEESDFDIKIKPAGGGATKELADLRDGIIRNIETISDAQEIYAAAGRNVVTAGFDGWRVTNAFLTDDSFDQDLIIEEVHDWGERVWFDPGSRKRDRSDSKYGFLLSEMTKDDYEAEFPEGSGESVDNNRTTDTQHHKPDGIVVGNFFFLKTSRVTLFKTNLGRVFSEEDKDFQKIQDEMAQSGEVVSDQRDIKKGTFFVRVFDGKEWLKEEEETVFATIPLVAVYGNFKVIENKTMYHGVVQKLMDPQRVLNYSLSREIEEGALAPRAKKWMTQEQAEGFTDKLQTMNTNNEPVQLYNHVPNQPVPFETGGAQINPGLRNISASMTQLMGSTAGIFAAGMGDTPDFTQSGIAIDKLQDKSNNITSKYFKALEVAICYTARLLDQGIRKVYDTKRQMTSVGEDGVSKLIEANAMVFDEQSRQMVMVNDLSAGKYDITCTSGPSFDSRQGEAVSSMIELAKVDPSILQIGGDILLDNSGAPGMGKVAERKRDQLFKAGVIPESQWTDEEKQQAAQAQQNQQPDAAMVLAQAEQAKAAAEQAKADAANAKVQVDLFKLQTDTQLKTEELRLKAMDLNIRERESLLKIEEKAQKLGLDADQQRFDQNMAVAEENRQRGNDAVDNLNTSADTLKKLREAQGIDAFTGPHARSAFIGQAQDIDAEINQDGINGG